MSSPGSLALVTAMVLGVSQSAARASEPVDQPVEQPGIYRCTAADGRIEFRQFPCHGRDESERLEIEDSQSGWTPPDPAEVFKDEGKTKPKAASAKANSDARKAAAVDRQREEKCWKKEHQLEQVNRRLRAGYKVSEGQRLRERRAEYEDFMKRFCD